VVERRASIFHYPDKFRQYQFPSAEYKTIREIHLKGSQAQKRVSWLKDSSWHR